MKNEKLKTETVHFVQFVDACGGKEIYRISPVPMINCYFESSVCCLFFFFAEGVNKPVRRTQLPFLLFTFFFSLDYNND